jgi:molybdopterin-biosynthesis enzyme MoeA-like protein
MKAMFDTVAAELGAGPPIGSWRRRYRTIESRIVTVLEAMAERHPGVLVGSYPSFASAGPEVEVVLKSSDADALAAAAAWIEAALDEATR